MQRYRVNFRLLASLIIGFMVAAVGSYFLWKFQVSRNSTQLLARADLAEKDGKLQDAFDALLQYTKLRDDDPEGSIRLASVAAQMAEEYTPGEKEFFVGYDALRSLVVVTDEPKIRRRLLDIQEKYGLFDLALVNAEELMSKGDADPKLKVTKAKSLFATQKLADGAAYCKRLIGYDQKKDDFDLSQAEAPNEPIVYALLAQYLSTNNQKELARKVIDQSIVVNPDSAEAYLHRYQVLKSLEDEEGSQSALAKAFELDPTDAAVIGARGMEEIIAYQTGLADAETEKSEEKRKDALAHLDVAGKLFTDGLKEYPDRVDFYERVARIALFRQRYQDAMDIIDKGIEEFPLKKHLGANGLPMAMDLVNTKFEVLFSQSTKDPAKLKEVLAEAKALKDLGNTKVEPIAEYQEARVDALEDRWSRAAARLEKVKPNLLNFPDLQANASFVQGYCHQRLGQDDLALKAYDWALEKNKNDLRAKMGREEILAKQRLPGREVDSSQLDQMVQTMLAKPEGQQDWEALYKRIDDFLDQTAAARTDVSADWVEARKKLMRAQTLVVRAEAAKTEAGKASLYKEARLLLTDAYNLQRDDIVVQMAVVRLLLTEPGKGPDNALKSLDNFVAKSKDSPAFRVLRSEIVAAQGGDDVADQLAKVVQGIDDWPADEQAQVWAAVAGRFEQLGRLDDAMRYVTKAVDLAPNSLQLRVGMFNLALKQSDDAQMQEAEKRILEIVGSKTDPDYVLADVKRRIILFADKKIDDKQMQEARAMLDAAIKARPTFGDLYVVRGQIALIYEKNVKEALRNFDLALERGQANLNAVALQVKLLAEQQKYKEARDRMDRIPEASWSLALPQIASKVLEEVGESEAAFSEAQKVAKAHAEDPKVQAWFGELAQRLGKLDNAEESLRTAVRLSPADPDVWARLISFYLRRERYVDVEREMRNAHLALDEEYLPLLNAQYYERQGRWQEAEAIYLAAYAGRTDNPAIQQRLAQFYLTWYRQSDANLGHAAVYINKILKAANDGKLPASDSIASWARRQAAKLLSLTGDYTKSLQGERLLVEAEKKTGDMPPDDKLQLIEVLDRRGDPEARQKQIELLEQLRDEKGLAADQELLLGRSLAAMGRWKDAKSQMAEAIGRFPKDGMLRVTLVKMLIDSKDRDPDALNEADRWLNRMGEVSGVEQSVGEMRLRVVAARGDKKALRTALESITPNLRVLDKQKLEAVRLLALLADDVGDHEYGLKLMREYVRRMPANQIQLTRMMALHGDLDEAIAMLQQQFDGAMEDVTTIAVEMLRNRRKEAPEKLDDAVNRFVRAARRDDPEAARFMVLEAEKLEIQEKFDDSVAAYRAVLAQDDIPNVMRATASNNLAFLLALKGTEAEQALTAVNDAIGLIGPLSDLLDTRGLAYLALKKPQQAAADFRLSAKSGPTASKYFHLCEALDAQGDDEGAETAWKDAMSYGLAPAKISTLEVGKYEEMAKKFGSAETASARP